MQNIMHLFRILSIIVCLQVIFVETERRQIRSFPKNSAMGYLIAVAIPLDVEQRNVFVSFNFEANYGLPTDPTTFKLDWFNTRDLKTVLKRSLINRKSIYTLIRDKLYLHGFPGNSCLLRMICEISRDPINDHNGLYGDIFQIIFTPSSSANEIISRRYHDAEMLGKTTGCQKYYDKCPHHVLDFITSMGGY